MAMISDLIIKGFNLNDKVMVLQNKVQILSARASDVSSELDMADFRVGKRRRREVELWLRNVRIKKSEIDSIDEDVKRARLVLPNMDLRNRIGRLSNEIEELMHQGEFRNGLMLEHFNGTRLPLVTQNLVGQMFSQNIKTIWSSLIDDKVQRIGIYGMGGVGKTSLMMHIHNRLIVQRNLGGVYWVTATQGSIVELQNKIAKSVGIDLPNDDDPRRRAATLSSILSRVGKLVLILDDLWKHCPLDDVGVPLSSTNCKVVVTTRSLDVCRRMSCQILLKVEPLSEEEAWCLFLCHLGNYESLSVDCKRIAKLITEECGGLPLGIRTMARSMSGVSDVDEWSNALQELRKPVQGQDDMENEVFPVLKFSYCHLNDVRLQSCFLSCVLYPEDSLIPREELIDLWIADGTLDDNETRQEKFHKGHTILSRLENLCLLEGKKSNEQGCVKMHDLIRDMGVNITKRCPHYMVYPRAGLNELPHENQWSEDVEKASFIHNHISEIAPGSSPRCPELSTLLLQCNPLESISSSFFLHMKSLSVLNLSFTSLTILPDSISTLSNLSALLLRGCWNLTYVPSLIKLEKLQELDLRHTRIKDAPDGLEGLTSLRSLDLSQIKDISSPFIRTIPTLYNLQVLKLSKTIEGKHFLGLMHLEKVHCRLVFDMNEWSKFIESRHHWKLKNYNFVLTGNSGNSNTSRHQGTLTGLDRIIVVSNSNLKGGKRMILLPQNIQYLGINDCAFRERGLIDALPSLNNTTELRVCERRNCEGLDNIWSPTLTSLHPLPNPPQTFSHFRKLHICSCPRISKLFPVVLLEQQLLPNLEEIELVNCPNVTEIISANEGVVGTKTDLLTLPKLKTLTLFNMPELSSICRGLLLCNSLVSLSKEKCAMLKMIPLSLPLLCDASDHTLRYLPTDIEWWTSLDQKYPKDVKLLRHALIKRSCLTSVV